MSNPPRLTRALTLPDTIGIGLGAIVGAGIYVVSGLGVDLAGASVLVSVGLAGIIASSNALSSAQLAAHIPETGGTYAYGYRLLSPWAGYVAGWMFLVAKLTAAATVALGFGAYLGWIAPAADPRWAAMGAVVVFTVLVRAGVRRTSQVNLVLVTISIGALVTFVAGAAPAVTLARLGGVVDVDASTLRASAIMFFAYTGYARIATLGEEVVDPQRTIPRAVLVTLVTAAVLYAAVTIVLIGVEAGDRLSRTGAPLLTVARASGTAWLPPVVVVGAGTAMLGVLLNQLLGISRMLFAMGRRGDLPSGLSRIDDRAEPTTAVVAAGVITLVLTLTGVWTALITVSAFCILTYYAIANAAALALDRAHRLYPPIVAIVGLIGCILFAVSLEGHTLLIGVGVLAAGVLVRVIRRPRAS